MARKVTERKVIMRAPVELKIGSTLLLPFNIAVSAGEPSQWKRVHEKYSDQQCIVVGITVRRSRGIRSLFITPDTEDVTILKVRFSDGFEVEAMPGAFIYVGPPKKRQTKKKK